MVANVLFHIFITMDNLDKHFFLTYFIFVTELYHVLVLFVCIVVRDMSTTCCLKVFFLKSCSFCRMLDDFSHEMDNTQSRLDNVMKKLAKVSHMTSGNMLGKKCVLLG